VVDETFAGLGADLFDLASTALAYWIEHAYDDLLENYPRSGALRPDPAEPPEFVGDALPQTDHVARLGPLDETQDRPRDGSHDPPVLLRVAVAVVDVGRLASPVGGHPAGERAPDVQLVHSRAHPPTLVHARLLDTRWTPSAGTILNN